MSQDIVNEVNFFLFSFVMGAVITFTYDWFLIFRRLVRHNTFFVSLEDLIFWISCALGVFYMLYRENNGILRWFAVFGAALGMLVYKNLLGRRFVTYASKILKKVFGVLHKIFLFFYKPVRKMVLFFALFLKKTGIKIKRILKLVKKKLTTGLKLLRIISYRKNVKRNEKKAARTSAKQKKEV